jgi:hypothetical protein
MLLQQAAKYIMKLYKKINDGQKVVDVFEYMNQLPNVKLLKSMVTTAEGFTDLSNVLENL